MGRIARSDSFPRSPGTPGAVVAAADDEEDRVMDGSTIRACACEPAFRIEPLSLTSRAYTYKL